MEHNVAKYFTQQIMTASPEKLVYMMYDRAITSLREAVNAIEIGDIEGRWKANNRATEILHHMWSTLDVEQGAEIADNLHQLLSFMILRLPEVDLRNNPAPALEAIQLLEPLRDSWKEIAMKGGTENSGSAGPAGSSNTDSPDAHTARTSLSA